MREIPLQKLMQNLYESGEFFARIPPGKGFGYDPVLVPDGYQQTFAQLGATVKNRISHRRRALALAAKVVQNWI